MPDANRRCHAHRPSSSPPVKTPLSLDFTSPPSPAPSILRFGVLLSTVKTPLSLGDGAADERDAGAADVLPYIEADLKKIAFGVVEKAKEICLSVLLLFFYYSSLSVPQGLCIHSQAKSTDSLCRCFAHLTLHIEVQMERFMKKLLLHTWHFRRDLPFYLTFQEQS